MTIKIHIDFETRSTVDLRKVGVYAYARHPDTEILCMAWAIDDGSVELWVPGQPFPDDIAEVMEPTLFSGGLEFWAHNANFERIIWEKLGPQYKFIFTEAPPGWSNYWHCSAAQCAAMGLPRSLEHAATALNLPYEKDKAGHSLMMQMCKPRSVDPLTWWDDDDRLGRLYDYCRQDVRVEREVEARTRALSPSERETYLLDQDMNDAGVKVDVPLIRAAKGIALEGIARANLVIAEHTHGEVERVTQVARMQKWLEGQGYDMESLAKANVAEMLQNDLPYDVEQVLLARSEAGKSSVAKLDTMLNGLVGDKLQGLTVYHGAHTGRWAGRRVQPQNFPRPTVADPEQYIDQVTGNEYDGIDLIANPVDVVASMLRSMIVGTPTLFAGDYSAIEAIVLPWLAGQDDLVARFATREDVYATEGKTVGATRQHGKAIILGCGFGMGAAKFVEAAMTMFGLDLMHIEADDFVRGYRERYTKIVAFWYGLQSTFIRAWQNPGMLVFAGKHIKMLRKGRYLWLTLPSGRVLCYTKPEVNDNEISIMRTNSQTGRMERRRIWGGVLAENVTQAVARDVMVSGLKRLVAHAYRPVLTVHDEIICERGCKDQTLEKFLALMSEVPEWAPGLPVFADGYEAERYRKG